MPRSASPHRRRSALVLHQKVKFALYESPFRTFDLVKRLDVERLERAARARFEVGWFESACGQRIVHAHVQRGKVTRLELEPCPGGMRMTPELRSLVQSARKALVKGRRPALRLPVPVGRFLSRAQDFTVDVFGCFSICIFGFCLSCCFGMDDPKLNTCEVWREGSPPVSPGRP